MRPALCSDPLEIAGPALLRCPPTEKLHDPPKPAGGFFQPCHDHHQPCCAYGTNGQLSCHVDFKDGRVVGAPSGVLLVPDVQSAYMVRHDFDKTVRSEQFPNGVLMQYSFGKPYCVLDPLVQAPSGPPAVTVAGGGLRTPGAITVPPVQTQPAAVMLYPVVAYGLPVAAATFAFLSTYWQKNAKPLVVPSGDSAVVAFNWGVDVLFTIRDAMRLRAEDLGILFNSDNQEVAEPTQKEIEDAERRLDREETPEGKRLSEGGAPGSCRSREERREYYKTYRRQVAMCLGDTMVTR